MSYLPILLDDRDAEDWRQEAACRDASPNLFFPIGATGEAIGQIAVAKQVCGGCCVRADCLEFALATNQESGVWGGTTEEERRRIRRTWLARRRDNPDLVGSG